MSGGMANIVRVVAAGICLSFILLLSAGSAFAHVEGHHRPAVMASFTLALTVEAPATGLPSDQTPGRECPAGVDCCTLGLCPVQDARLDSGATFDFEYQIRRHGYPEHLIAELVGIAAMPSTPPPRLSA